MIHTGTVGLIAYHFLLTQERIFYHQGLEQKNKNKEEKGGRKAQKSLNR